MKVLLEVPLNSSGDGSTRFSWLPNSSNLLFTIEDGRRIKTIETNQDPGKQIQSASLGDSSVCTSLSCNKDGSSFALIIDRRQLFFWEVKTNKFVPYKPNQKFMTPSGQSGKRSVKPKSMDLVKWSKVSNKLLLCYSSGQMLLSDCQSANIQEKFIDNSDGVLKTVHHIEASEKVDIFVCITIISEILIMSFDGELKYYLSGDSNMLTARLSPDFRSRQWLATLSKTNDIHLRVIGKDEKTRESPEFKLTYKLGNDQDNQVVDFYWLDFNILVLILASGEIVELYIKHRPKIGIPGDYELTSRILNNRLESSVDELVNNGRVVAGSLSKSLDGQISVAIITKHQIRYYEFLKIETSHGYECEKVDDLDLSSCLERVNLSLERVKWSPDCSKLAVMLSNGHLLVYRTRLPDLKVNSYGSRVAYLSAPDEVTILNYEFEGRHASDSTSNDENASLIKITDKASVLAVGSNCLAVGFNNRIRFYRLENKKTTGSDEEYAFVDEEFISVVASLSLNDRYVAIQFSDGRLKLKAIPSAGSLESTSQNLETNERFFPDPAKPEKICTFTLTRGLFLYCTHTRRIHVFDLASWSPVQVYDHSAQFHWPIRAMRANKANKFICLLNTESLDGSTGESDAYLYDLFTNSLISVFGPTEQKDDKSLSHLMMFKSQVRVYLPELSSGEIIDDCEAQKGASRSGRTIDSLWDADGRTFLLIEKRKVHIFALVSHSFGAQGRPVLVYVDSASKASNYSALYASQGILSCQTSLGRLVNKLLDAFDDETKLTKLEKQIQCLKDNLSGDNCNSELNNHTQRQVMKLKTSYVSSILAIYPASRCREICEHLMSDSQFNLFEEEKQDFDRRIDKVIWIQLATWSLYTMNLHLALAIYRRHKLSTFARCLDELLSDIRLQRLDLKSLVRMRILELIGD